MSGTVLVPIDASDQAQKAIRFAADWAINHDATLHLLHAADIPTASELGLTQEYSYDMSDLINASEKLGQDLVSAAMAKARELGVKSVTGSVAVGDPAETAIDTATDLPAALIVMGTRGMSNWKNLLLGSVSHKVLQLAPCTTVIVR